MTTGRRPALFLDRDGVINHDKSYVHKAEDFEFIDGIFELVSAANQNGYLVIVVTNQAGIGRGLYSEDDFQSVTKWMCQEFEKQSAIIDAVYHSPFHPTHGIGEYKQESIYRKPNPGMFDKAVHELNVDISSSIMVGDKHTDMVAAARAGIIRRFLFRNPTPWPGSVAISNLSEVSGVLPR